MKKTKFKNDMGFNNFLNINISNKLHCFVSYSPWDVHRIADK